MKKLPGGRRSPGKGTIPPQPEPPRQPRSWRCRGCKRGSVGRVLGTMAVGCSRVPAPPGGICMGASRDTGRHNVWAEPGLLSKAKNLQPGSCAYCVD